jgi:Domain of unknown function (DUF5664)
MSDKTKEFSTGMQRSNDVEHLKFTAIHPIAMIALAKVLGTGSEKYGNRNYELGSDVEDNLNHVLRHLCLYLSGDRSEPHLANSFCGLMFAIVNDTLHPELNKGNARGPGCTLTPDILSHLEATKPDRERRRESGEFDKLGDWKLEDVPEIKRILEQRAAQ